MTRAVAWVRALTAGRRRVVAHAPRPAMVLALRPVPVFNTFSSIRRRCEIHRHDHRHLMIVGPARGAATRGPALAPPAVVARLLHSNTAERVTTGPAGPSLVLAPPPFARATSLPAAAQSIRAAGEQLADQHRRVEGPAHPLRAIPVAGSESEPLGEARRRLRGVPVLAAPPAPARLSPAPAMVIRRSPVAIAGDAPAGRERSSPRPPAAQPIDLDSLTDHVVEQIDRRIVAHRERLGQI